MMLLIRAPRATPPCWEEDIGDTVETRGSGGQEHLATWQFIEQWRQTEIAATCEYELFTCYHKFV